MTLTLKIGSTIVYGVHPGNDNNTVEALETATSTHNAMKDLNWHKAIVDRNDGLCLIFGDDTQPSDHPNDTGWHFRSARCGYAGTGVIASAIILEMFGFGVYGDIYAKISEGGAIAHYEF